MFLLLGIDFSYAAPAPGTPQSYTPYATPYTGTEEWYCTQSITSKGSCSVSGISTTLFGNVPTGVSFPDRFRSFQSFGAVGDGVTDDTMAVSTALNSGKPIECYGTFLISSVVTITNIDVYVQGSNKGCTILYNTPQSEIYATLRGADLYNSNKFVMRDVFLSINAQITSVTGPLKTAAIFIYYPLGLNGVTQDSVIMDNVKIKPTAAGNFVINGIYLYDTGVTRLNNMLYEGNRTTFQTSSNAYVYDGVHSPSAFTVYNSVAFYAERGIYMPQESNTSWQGVRVRDFDCVWCDIIVEAEGSADGSSDQIDLQSIEGTYNKYGILINNVTHIFLHENYLFAAKTTTGQVTQANPVCMQIGQTLSPTPYPAFNVHHNSCDGVQYSGATTKFGTIINGFDTSHSVNGVLGPNTYSNLDVGDEIFSGTAGVLLYPSSTLNVTTPVSNLSTGGVNSRVTSSAY
jgi:hypothetical protein